MTGKTFRLVLVTLILWSPASVFAVAEDPWKPMNKKVHGFNDTADRWVAKPIAKGYDRVVPGPVTRSISHFFKNLSNVNNSVNNLFQFKLRDAGTDIVRLAVNLTVGIGGLWDPATKMGLPQSEEDWGQTFAVWRIGSGPYLVIPLMGPSTVRDSFGLMADSFFNPVLLIDHVPTRNTVWAMDKINARANLLGAEKLVIGDKYLFYRDAYLQRREYLIHDGQIEDPFDDDF